IRRIKLGKLDPIERNAAGGRIVVAQQQMKDRALAGAGWSDDCKLLSGPDVERDAIEGRDIRAGWIGKMSISERDFADRRTRQLPRKRWRCDRRRDGENFKQSLGGAGSLRHLAADFGERTERAAGKHRVEDELAETAGRNLARQHLLRA